MARVARVGTNVGRLYRLTGAGGQEAWLPAVTSVLAMADRPALTPWAVRMCMDAARGELVQRLQAATSAKPFAVADVEAALGTAAKAADKHRDAAGDFGTRVHNAIDAIIAGGEAGAAAARPDGTVATDEGDIAAAVAGFRRWWRSAEGARYQLSPCGDTIVYSRRYGYAGAADCLGVDRESGRIVVFDFKTSNSIHSQYAMQLAAYLQAVSEMAADGELTLPGKARPTVDPRSEMEGLVLRIDKTTGATELKRVVDFEAAFDAFKACLLLWHAAAAPLLKAVPPPPPPSAQPPS